MSRQAKKDIPRWRRNRLAPAGPVIRMSNKQAGALTRAIAERDDAGQPGQRPLAATGAYRYRHQLVPFWLLLGIVAIGETMHVTRQVRPAILCGLAFGTATVLLTRHLKGFGAMSGAAAACLIALFLPLLAVLGLFGAAGVFLLVLWSGLAIGFVLHYRIRDDPAPDPVDTDKEIWGRIVAKRKWAGKLQDPQVLPGGGRQWTINLDGAETHIGQVMGEPRAVAAAYGKSLTEAYVEPAPDGNESFGRLTILRKNTLEKSREWDGKGIDPETGLAVVGRFPDGQPVHERYYVPGIGVRHTIVAGADGCGKTSLIDLGLSQATASGIIAPVILDPQLGQALPAWRGWVPYACGAEECLIYLIGLQAAMLDRSAYLANDFRWTGPDGSQRTGIGSFDATLTGLPIVEITVDESPALLANDARAGLNMPELGFRPSTTVGDAAAAILGGIGKLGRKAGCRIRLAVQVPSLAELRSPALRSMLIGGNLFCGRTGDQQTQGMIGIQGDPRQIPKYFSDGVSPTVCLGYTDGPDNRPGTPMRWDWVPDPYAVAQKAAIRQLDERWKAAMNRAMAKCSMQLAASQAPSPEPGPPLAAVPEDDSPAPGGQIAADAILAVLDRPMERGEIIKLAQEKSLEWGRSKAFCLKTISTALAKLVSDGTVAHPEARAPYAPSRPTLHVLPGSGSNESEAG